MQIKLVLKEAKRVGFLTFCLLFSFSVLVFAKEARPSKVEIRKYNDSRYRLLVNRRDYAIKGVCYNPVPIGEGYDYDFFNDPRKPWLVDGALMKQAGINTIRLYQPSDDTEAVKELISDLYNKFGIRTILGNWLGFWNYPGPCYGDEEFCQCVKEEVLEMVRTYKDEPGILFWVLGNENNYTFDGRIRPWSTEEIDELESPMEQKHERAKLYYSFVNQLAKEIKEIDPNHPVCLGNGELIGLEVANEVCPDIDMVGVIVYRGKTFGNMFKGVKNYFDRPIVFIEFGADSYDAYLDKEDQGMQSFFLEAQWVEIYKNMFRSKEGEGNCLGGFIFEWTDEWWKHNEYNVQAWSEHDTTSNWSNGAYYFDIKAKNNKNMNEEWFGIVGIKQSETEGDLDQRIPKKSYYVLREFWKNPAKRIREIKNEKKNMRR